MRMKDEEKMKFKTKYVNYWYG